jgi:hypothetical protein
VKNFPRDSVYERDAVEKFLPKRQEAIESRKHSTTRSFINIIFELFMEIRFQPAGF